VGTLLGSVHGTDVGVRRNRETSKAVAKASHAPSTGRNRAVRTDVVNAIRRGDRDTSDDKSPREACPDPVPPSASRDKARQTLAQVGARLLADARSACRRDGVAATGRELCARVAKRIGLPQAEVARGLNGQIRRDRIVVATAAAGGIRHRRDPVSRMATMILGARERDVFLARRDTRPDDIAALHQLASRLGISADRVYELEASARRKLARALG